MVLPASIRTLTRRQWWCAGLSTGINAPVREGKESQMSLKKLTKLGESLVRDEQGGEVLEYALIAGLIVVAAVVVIGSVGTKVLARWNSVNSGL